MFSFFKHKKDGCSLTSSEILLSFGRDPTTIAENLDGIQLPLQINQIPNAEFTPEKISGGERVKQHQLFMNIGQKHFYQRVKGQLFFFAIISYGASIFLCKHLSLSCHMVNLLIHQCKQLTGHLISIRK